MYISREAQSVSSDDANVPSPKQIQQETEDYSKKQKQLIWQKIELSKEGQEELREIVSARIAGDKNSNEKIKQLLLREKTQKAKKHSDQIVKTWQDSIINIVKKKSQSEIIHK
jgi:hypothetical protein